jgi:release factor glutamine methyltransferase
VLVPRPETEGLVEHVLQVLRSQAAQWPQPRVLDLGTGSGAIALAIATEYPPATVTATDASAAALAVARRNAARLAAGDRVR